MNDIHTLYKRRTRNPEPNTDKPLTGKDLGDLSKVIAAMNVNQDSMQRKLDKLTKDIKYLRDRVSNSERRIDQFSAIIDSLNAKVQRVMGIFRR